MHKSIPLETPIELINIEPMSFSPLISKCQIKVCYVSDEPNRNGSVITKEVASEMAPSLRGSPIVGYYNTDKEDFEEHNRLLEIKGGKIINTSSIASVVPLPFQAFDSATKSALDTLFSALREEVYDYNVTVTSIMPGDAKTDFTKNRVKNQSNQAYKEVCEKSVKTMEKDEAHGITPQTVARVAFKIANKKRPPYTKLVGKKDSFLCFLFKILPKRFRSFLVRKIYASK